LRPDPAALLTQLAVQCYAIAKGKAIMEKYDMIVAAEQQFAREVTLGVIVGRPLTVWHYIIPGMFIIDFLRRGSAIKQYTRRFMFPIKLALDAARAEIHGQDKTAASAGIEDDISKWLHSLDLYTPELRQAQTAVVDVLTGHYSKLLKAEGDTYLLLIKNAYQNREGFKAFLDQITAAEKEVDSEIMNKFGEKQKLTEKLWAEQKQVEKRRQKIMEDIF
jgi:hypothetical protein